MKRVLIIGIGSFGSALVESLHKSGAEVIVIDKRAEALEHIKEFASHAAVGDGSDYRILEALEAGTCDAAVICHSEDFEAEVLTVAALKRIGGKLTEIAVRANSRRRAEVLTTVGATRVIELEREGGARLGEELMKSTK